jgi:hypothetical protein
MQKLTPEPIRITAGLGAPREERLGPHRTVVGAVAVGQVRVAPADVEDFQRRVSIGLTAGTKRTTKRRRFSDELCHDQGPHRTR